MYGLSSFFIGEQRVAEELGPIMLAAPTEEMRVFLCTQIADEARHVRFFNRFYDEVGVLEANSLQGRLAETSEHLNPEFDELFDEMLKSRVDRLARHPDGLEALVEAVTLYYMVIEACWRSPATTSSSSTTRRSACFRDSSRASTRSLATSTAMSRSAPAFYARWRLRTRSTATR
jgi:ribonucleoside-diphosphate reductase beta chain